MRRLLLFFRCSKKIYELYIKCIDYVTTNNIINTIGLSLFYCSFVVLLFLRCSIVLLLFYCSFVVLLFFHFVLLFCRSYAKDVGLCFVARGTIVCFENAVVLHLRYAYCNYCVNGTDLHEHPCEDGTYFCFDEDTEDYNVGAFPLIDRVSRHTIRVEGNVKCRKSHYT